MKTFAAFFAMMLVLLTAPVFAFESTGEASCYGNFSGSWFWQRSDSTITEKWEWKNLGSMYPTLGRSGDVDPGKVFGRVTTSQSTFGRGNVGVSADGSVSGPEYSLELGFEFKIRSVGGITGTWDSTQKSTTGSKSTTTAGSYTMSGTGEVIGVSGAGGITVEGTGFKGHGAISFSSSPPFQDPGTLSVTIEKDLPKAYECSHSSCEAALPSRDYHLVTCGKNIVNHHGSIGTCKEKYYICQNDCINTHVPPSGSGSGSRSSTPSTPTDNTPNCQDCTSHCSSPCSCTNSGTCNGTVVDSTPNCSGCTSHCSSPCSCLNSGTCNGTVTTPPSGGSTPPEDDDSSSDDSGGSDTGSSGKVLTCSRPACGNTWQEGESPPASCNMWGTPQLFTCLHW